MRRLVSVILPIFNAKKYLKNCLNSLLSQSYENIEFILIDDGSTDNSKLIIDQMNLDSRFKYYYQNNSGVSVARNNGMLKANGEYIIFADADDTYEKDSIAKMINTIESGKYELACFSYRLIKSFNRKVDRRLEEKKIVNALNFNQLSCFVDTIPNGPWGKVFLKRVIKQFNINFDKKVPYAEDTIFLINYMSHIKRIVVSQNIVYNYNIKDGNASASKKYYPKIDEYFKDVMSAKEEYCLFNNQKYNKNIDAKRYFDECIEHRIYHAQEEKIKDDIVSFSIEEDYVTLLQNYKKVHRIRMLKDKVKRIMML